MALTAHTKILGERCNSFLREHLPQDAPVKRLADILGQSRQTAARLYLGDAPTSVQLMALAQHFGKDFVVRIFEPLVGDMSEASTASALSRVEELLIALRTATLPNQVRAGHATPVHAVPVSRDMPLAQVSGIDVLRHQLQEYRDRSGRLELAEAIALARSDPKGQTVVNVRRRNDVVRCAYKARSSRIHGPDTDWVGRA